MYIQNVSKEHGYEYGKGKQTYVLGINHNRFVKFEHQFEEGLSSCLRAAADAFDYMEKSGKPKIFEIEDKEKMKAMFNMLIDIEGLE